MQFNAQSCPALSELQKHWVCLYNQSPANPHDYRNGTLAHALSPWQSDADLFIFFFYPLYIRFFPPPLHYDWNWWFSVFEGPPLVMCTQPGSLRVVFGSWILLNKNCLVVVVIRRYHSCTAFLFSFSFSWQVITKVYRCIWSGRKIHVV